MESDLPRAWQPATRARRHTHPVLAVVVALAVTTAVTWALKEPLIDALAPEFLRPVGLGGAVRNAIFLAVLTPVILGLLWLWLRLYERRPLRTVGFFGSNVVRKAAYGFILAVALSLIPFVVARLAGWGGHTATDLPAAWPSILAGLAVMGIAFVAQSTVEETVFRGFLAQSIGLRWKPVAAVVIQAVVFSGSHVLLKPSGLEFLMIFFIGLFLAGYALLEGSLWGACAFHGAWNWCNSVIPVWFTDAPEPITVLRELVVPPLAALTVFALLLRRGIPRAAPQQGTSVAPRSS